MGSSFCLKQKFKLNLEFLDFSQINAVLNLNLAAWRNLSKTDMTVWSTTSGSNSSKRPECLSLMTNPPCKSPTR